VRPEQAHLFEQPNAFFTRHALVGHDQADFVLVFFEEFQAVPGVGGGQYPELVAKRAREGLQRFLLIIHIKNGEFFIIRRAAHKHFGVRSVRHYYPLPAPEIPA
jgi:hypothetical protein